ncbi:glutamate 5-kinase [Legionella oakridgensis]|uniref:Glutamate 5-kinase n=2 Tax=Legionella oakridgensis TaxID=29423 RepID=W0BB00_9GAMM|nr:glutamate 5-kinase [Legionella oakridgensis]AHE67718.1 glutamate 5-kinase [Legionella oakridgensis ATCC 33761 = DSM 21215]ETO92726.1 glutamate 5-kinase [Legionella oakridgensis RV-2-2007]KTD36950.1 glutamate 5-kinase [Legionella oakridgensis]STY20741.1 glutamate 5-kinase [Legionella longbeachae]
MKIVIKVGTRSILSEDGTPCEAIMLDLVKQIAFLQQAGHQVVLVSSGAVGSGRKVAEQYLGRRYGSSIGEKQVLASLGQHELMHLYASMFKSHHLLASQLLLTKQDFRTRQHYLNIARLIHELLKHNNIIPIINENDSVAIEELMFTDNDELAGLIAAQINADKLIILSIVDGVYLGHPDDMDAKLIQRIDSASQWPDVSSTKSTLGRGGMHTKLGTAKKMSELGITTHIANINQPDIILRLMQEESLGTVIIPSRKKSNIKRWIAYSSDNPSGAIYVNLCLLAILEEKNRIISILPVGIEKLTGAFKKGDLVEIRALDDKKVGVGIARYDATQLNDYLGQKDKPAFIHYDQLHLYSI